MPTTPTRPSRPRRPRHIAAVGAAILAAAVAGCAGPEDDASQAPPSTPPSSSASSPAPSASESPSPALPSTPSTPSEPSAPATPTKAAGPALEISITDDKVQPNAVDLDLAVGEPLTITFDTDRGGELHVHSKPEQYIEFEAGTSTEELVIETPGSVEIEEHDTEAVVAVVQVR